MRNTFKGTRYKPNEPNGTITPDLEYPVREILKTNLKLNLESVYRLAVIFSVLYICKNALVS